MAKLVRALRPSRSPHAPHRLALLVSSVTAAAGLSVSQVLLRRRSAERGTEHRSRYRIGPRRGDGHELRLLTAAPPAPAQESQTTEPRQEPAARPAMPDVRLELPAWPLTPERRLTVLAPAVRRVYRRGRQALAKVRKKPSDERWQELGKRSKDLWHLSNMLQPVTPKAMKKVTKQAHRLSDLLGEDHDLALLEQRMSAQPLSEKELRLLRRLIARRRRELQDESQLLARRLYRRKPGEFARRLGLS